MIPNLVYVASYGWISPDKTIVSICSNELLQVDIVHPPLLVQRVVTQPAGLRALLEVGVAIPSHDVPGLKEFDYKRNILYPNYLSMVLLPLLSPDQYCWSVANLSTMSARPR